MIIEDFFKGTLGLVSRALDLRAMRHRIIASNLANITTPGYKARDISFEEALGRSLKDLGRPTLVRTDPRHLSGPEPVLEGIRLSITASSAAAGSADGNTVDEDLEMEKLAENQLVYMALVRVISRKIASIKEVIREGGR